MRKNPPKLQLHLEALQECFQLATVLLCQLLSHLHLFSQSIMKYCNLFMKYSGSSWLKNLTSGKKKEKKKLFAVSYRRHLFKSLGIYSEESQEVGVSYQKHFNTPSFP